MTQTQNTQTARQYRAHLTLHNGNLCTVNGPELKEVEQSVQNIILGQAQIPLAAKAKPVRFEQQTDNSTFIFHESYQTGQEPLGWIVESEVPLSMSVKRLIEQRREAQQVRAA